MDQLCMHRIMAFGIGEISQYKEWYLRNREILLRVL